MSNKNYGFYYTQSANGLQEKNDRFKKMFLVEDGASLKVVGNGGITIDDSSNIANMFQKNGTTGALILEAGTYDWDVSEYCTVLLILLAAIAYYFAKKYRSQKI